MAPFHSPLMNELIMQTERDLMISDFERMRRHHLLPDELESGGGLRSWVATRLAGIALRLDRPAAEGALSG